MNSDKPHTGAENSRRWAVLSMLFTVHVLTAAGMFSISLLIPLIKQDFSLSHAQVGFLSGSFYLGMAAASLFTGWAVDLFGVRRAILCGTALLGGILIVTAGLENLMAMAVLLAAGGVGYSVVTPSSNKVVMLCFSDNVRATAMGFKQTGINGGGFLAGIVLPPVALALNWRWAMTTAGGIALTSIFFIVWLFRGQAAERSALPAAQWLVKLKTVVSDRNLLLLSLEGFFRVAVQMAFITYLVLSLQKVFGLKLVLASFLFALAQGAGAAGRIAWGVVSDRVFRGRRKVVYALVGAIATAAFGVFGSLDRQAPVWLVFATTIVLGFTAVGHQGVGLTLMGECIGKELTGTATGFGQSLSFCGAMLAAPGFGFVVDRYGSFAYAWFGLAILSFSCCAILFFVKEKPKERTCCV